VKRGFGTALIVVGIALNGGMGLLMLLAGDVVRGLLQLPIAFLLVYTGMRLRNDQPRMDGADPQ
jgi:hypothetical protein